MQNGLSLSTRLQVPEGIAHRDLEGELVLLNLNTGVYFGLDPVGTRIWHLLQNQHSLQQVLNTLLLEYEVTEPQCRKDLLDLVAQLLGKELVQVSHDVVA